MSSSKKLKTEESNQTDEKSPSDVTFLVGEEKKPIHGHKNIIGKSEVFEKMLYGELAPKDNQPIEIKDTSFIGFSNIIRFLYGEKIEFKIEELHETFLAADKYILIDLIKELDKNVNDKIELANAFLLFDEVRKINEINPDFGQDVKKFIERNIESLVQTDEFLQISESTLMAVLNFKILCTSEVFLLKACWEWATHQCSDSSKENKFKAFEPIKNLFNFSEIEMKDFLGSSKIIDLLNSDFGKLFIQAANESNDLQLGSHTQKTKRKKFEILKCIFNDCHHFPTFDGEIFYKWGTTAFSFEFSVSHQINITFIQTTIHKNLNLEFSSISYQDKSCKEELKCSLIDGYWCMIFKDHKTLIPNRIYRITVNTKEFAFELFNDLNDENVILRTESEDDSDYYFEVCTDNRNIIKMIKFYKYPF